MKKPKEISRLGNDTMGRVKLCFEKHGGELIEEVKSQSPLIKAVTLYNEGYRIQSTIELVDGSKIVGKLFFLNELDKKFPDCRIKEAVPHAYKW